MNLKKFVLETVYTDVIKKHANIDQEEMFLMKMEMLLVNTKVMLTIQLEKEKGFTVKGAHVPHFVIKLNPKDNTIVVGKRESLEINEVLSNNLNMYIDDKKFSCGVKLRYRSTTIPCDVEIR